jgi:hypothetical protein
VSRRREPPGDSGQPGRPRHAGATDRLLSFATWWGKVSDPRRSPRLKRLGLLAAVGVFLLATVLAYRRFPVLEHHLSWPLLAIVAIVGVPATIALNGVEYALSARLLGHRVPFVEAVRIGLLGTAANQLPIPGAVLVRIRALNRMGSSYAKASMSTAAVGLTWMGLSGLIGGSLLLAGTATLLGAGLLIGGAVAVATASFILRTQSGGGSRMVELMARLAAVEAGFVAVSAFRLFLVLRALGFRVSVAQAAALTVSIVVAAAAGFFPGGLGLRELIAAGIGSLVGLPAAVGVLATAMDRMVALVVLSIMSLAALWLFPGSRPSDPSPEVADPGERRPAHDPHEA